LKSSTNADPSKNLTRIASTPMGSETTSPYWYTIGDWSYMMFVVQHPYEVNTFHGDDDAQWASITATNAEGKLCTCRLPEGHSSLYSCVLYICHEPQLCNCGLSEGHCSVTSELGHRSFCLGWRCGSHPEDDRHSCNHVQRSPRNRHLRLRRLR
jgi:hypothetical protein